MRIAPIIVIATITVVETDAIPAGLRIPYGDDWLGKAIYFESLIKWTYFESDGVNLFEGVNWYVGTRQVGEKSDVLINLFCWCFKAMRLAETQYFIKSDGKRKVFEERKIFDGLNTRDRENLEECTNILDLPNSTGWLKISVLALYLVNNRMNWKRTN